MHKYMYLLEYLPRCYINTRKSYAVGPVVCTFDLLCKHGTCPKTLSNLMLFLIFLFGNNSMQSNVRGDGYHHSEISYCRH